MIHKRCKINYQAHLKDFQTEIFMEKKKLAHNLRLQEFKINNILSKLNQRKITFRKQNQLKSLLKNFMVSLMIKIDKQFSKKKMLLFKGMKN